MIRKHAADGKPVIGIRTASHAFALRKETPPDGHGLGTNGTKQSWEGITTGITVGENPAESTVFLPSRSSHSQEPQASLRDPGLALPKFSLALRIRPTLAERSRGLLPNRSPGRTDRLTAAKLLHLTRSAWRTSRNPSSTSFFSTQCNGALKKNSLLGQFEGRTFMPETSPKFPILVDKENTLRT